MFYAEINPNKSLLSCFYPKLRFQGEQGSTSTLLRQMACMCDNSCLLRDKDPKEHSKQMHAWIPTEGYLQKHSRSPPVCAVSYQSGCRKWDPWAEMLSVLPRIYSHHSFPYLCWDNRSPLTARGLSQTQSLSASQCLSWAVGHFISDRGPQEKKKRKNSQFALVPV